MAVVIGHPGQSARKNWFVNLLVPPFAFFVAAVVVTPFFLYSATRLSPLIIALESIVGLCVGLYFWRDSFREIAAMMLGASKWAKGADGEALVGQELSTLPDSYIVFHDFNPTSAGVKADWNVDHIVIGPNGMFVVETKNYSRVSVQAAAKSSFTRKNVAQVRRNSLTFKDKIRTWSAGKLGDVFVVPILVYAQEGAFVKQTREGEVHVIPLRWLANEITRHRARRQLDPDEIYRIAHVMFQQLAPYLMDAYRAELDRYGVKSRRFKLERANGRSAATIEAVSVAVPLAVVRVTKPKAPVGFPGVVPSVCPNCGGKLVRRMAGTGPRTGKPFLGCVNFYSQPRCGFIYNLEA